VRSGIRSDSVGSIKVPVPSAGYRTFDCHLIGIDSAHGVIRGYMTWMNSLSPGSHIETDDGRWDVVQIPCDANSEYVSAGQNYQLIFDDGTVVGEGQADSAGQWAADCTEIRNGRRAAAWAASKFHNDGSLFAPQPIYVWPDGGGSGSTTPPPPPPVDTTPVPVPVTRVVISATNVTGGVGDAPVITATAYHNDSVLSYAPSWSSTDETVASWDDGSTFPIKKTARRR